MLYNFRLGKYTCHTYLGAGAYGTVYGCTHDNGKLFAIKTFDSTKQKSYGNELNYLNQLLAVPYVIQKHAHGFISYENIKSIIVLEKAEYDMQSLSLWKDREDDEAHTMRKYFAQLALAIYGIHLKGIIHEDIKPGNILIMEEGRIAITDFGLSQSGQVFMSRWECKHEFQAYYHPRMFGGTYFGNYVDWWAFGVILHQFFCDSKLPTNLYYFDYNDLVECRQRSTYLPVGILDLFILIFSSATYTSHSIIGAPTPAIDEVTEATVAIGFQIGCQIVNMEYFDLKTEPSWEDWKNACVEIQRNKV